MKYKPKWVVFPDTEAGTCRFAIGVSLPDDNTYYIARNLMRRQITMGLLRVLVNSYEIGMKAAGYIFNGKYDGLVILTDDEITDIYTQHIKDNTSRTTHQGQHMKNIPQDDGTRPRRVVCAAMLLTDGNIVIGTRHYDTLMHRYLALLRDTGVETLKVGIKQGFIDQWGKYMSRTEAWQVAMEAKQIIRRCGGDTAEGGTLFSENIY